MSNAKRDTYSANARRLGGVGEKSKGSAKSSDQDSHVIVVVRCRPMSEKEISDGHQSIVELEGSERIVVHDVSGSPGDQLGTSSSARGNYSHVYDFNAVFDWNSTQKDIYEKVCQPIVDSVLEGYNGTIFAYGQTGTGKTYTMDGVTDKFNQQSRRRSQPLQPNSGNPSDINQQQQEVSRSPSVSSVKSSHQNSTKKNVGIAVATTVMGNDQRRASNRSSFQNNNDQESIGVIPRAFEQIFDHVAKSPDIQFLIRASYLEIYQEEIHDLLRRDKSIKLELHERPDIGVYVKDLTSFVCKSITEIERVMKVGNQNRVVGATDMNEHSSRSHAIFMITVEQQKSTKIYDEDDGSAELNDKLQNDGSARSKSSSSSNSGGNNNKKQQEHVIRVGKLNLVDLAGSERQRKTNSFGQRQKESIKINLSLSALGNVINSLMKMHTQQSQQQLQLSINTAAGFTPYRDSKLTRLLQDSLGGNAKTLMIANIGPASYNYDETINTLNYASRAKCIRNRPRLNEDPKDTLLRELQREIDELRSKLAAINNSNSIDNNGRRTSASTGGGKHDGTSKKSGGNQQQLQQQRQRTATEQKLIESELIGLKQKLSSLESKLLNGDHHDGRYFSAKRSSQAAACSSSITNVVDQRLLQGYTVEQEQELERKRAELANQVGRERAIRNELERREEAELLAKQSFSSIQQEVAAKNRLIRQILLKIKSMRDDIEAAQKAYRLELDELDQLQYVLHKELKLKCLIMDNFIPNHHVDQLLPRIVYDERKNCCARQLPIDLPLDFCNLNDQSIKFEKFWLPTDSFCIRPQSEFERIAEAIYPGNIRYKYENLIEPNLDLPKSEPLMRSTNGSFSANNLDHNENCDQGRENLITAPSKIQTLIDSALSQHEPDIVV